MVRYWPSEMGVEFLGRGFLEKNSTRPHDYTRFILIELLCLCRLLNCLFFLDGSFILFLLKLSLFFQIDVCTPLILLQISCITSWSDSGSSYLRMKRGTYNRCKASKQTAVFLADNTQNCPFPSLTMRASLLWANELPNSESITDCLISSYP